MAWKLNIKTTEFPRFQKESQRKLFSLLIRSAVNSIKQTSPRALWKVMEETQMNNKAVLPFAFTMRASREGIIPWKGLSKDWEPGSGKRASLWKTAETRPSLTMNSPLLWVWGLKWRLYLGALTVLSLQRSKELISQKRPKEATWDGDGCCKLLEV